jgi:opacity protein-like surface antigen
MFKSIVSSAALAIGVALPATAAAQGATGGGACPPGSWFCAQDSQQQPTPKGQAVRPLQPLPDPEDDATAAPSTPPPPPPYDPGAAPPPVVVYQPPPPVMITRPETPPPYEYGPPGPPPGEPYRHRPQWGLNLHLEGATIGHGTNGNASMGGGGLGLRLKPNPYFGIETDVDFVGGTDYQGDNRNETAVTFNGLFFLNPRSRMQLYLLAGFGWSGAHVTSNSSSLDDHYGYFGGQIGGGLEFRVSRNFALDLDLRGFIRGRTDQLAQTQPEFTNADGRTTNTSGGGLFTGGMTIYF